MHPILKLIYVIHASNVRKELESGWPQL